MRWPSWVRFGYPSDEDTCVVYEPGGRCPYRVMEQVMFVDRLEAPGVLRVCAWHGGRLREAMGQALREGDGS